MALLEEFGIDSSIRRGPRRPFTVQGTHTLVHTPGAVMNLPAVVLIALLTTLLVIGIKESANFNNVIVFVKIAIVFLVIGFGAMYVNTANWHPFIPPNTGEIGPLRLSRHRARRGGDLLRLHRLRRRLDGGAGGEESAEGHADRHPALARHLHRAVHPDVARDDRADAVHRR